MSAFSEANRKAFDELSATYNTKPWQLKLSAQVSEALEKRMDWMGVEWAKPDDRTSGRQVRLLDYACGTGSITKALGSSVTTIRGIDISENMVKVYNEAARSSGLTVEQANAVVGDLFATDVPNELQDDELYNFDIAVVGLGFHHFEDPALAVKRLAERLKAATGTLIIIDFLPFDRKVADQPKDMPDMSTTIKHNGFIREGMNKLFTDAGLGDFGFDILSEPTRMELQSGPVERTIFIARGRKAPTVWGKVSNWFYSMQDGIGGQLGVKRDDGKWTAGLDGQTQKGTAPWSAGLSGSTQKESRTWQGGL
ncbi:Hypothetical protein R9X50_00050500 [Acrodontium crateriforme]|uniref:Methyltransferase type 11 domain-containing protein n=1 Tax=Acrodontium crateriforme TaxID=150365 RepID=A0AAQ3LYW9_9PEZI|nr:Hypothetical protein R9X50_00050500 [Acrodontium crateriforme]